MGVFEPVFLFLLRLGAFSLLLVGILDSSFLFLPFGNDILMVTLAAREPARIAFYAAMATGGSLAGSMIIDYISRKGGERGLSRVLPAGRIEYVKGKVRTHAGWAIATAALLPPPFPFTPFVAAAAALQFPRWKMVAILASARMLRFIAIGLLGISFGNRILELAERPAVRYALIGLLIVCVAGSAWSVYGWVRRSRHAEESVAA